MAEEMLSLPD